tara:strand:- start:1287 stop:1640 length:354 start_codon:yes stop_codon:yes gene_type:complete
MTFPLVCIDDLPKTDLRKPVTKRKEGKNTDKRKTSAEQMRLLMLSNLCELERRTTSLSCRVQNLRQFLARSSPKMYEAAVRSAPEMFQKLEEIEEAAHWIVSALDAGVGDPRGDKRV